MLRHFQYFFFLIISDNSGSQMHSYSRCAEAVQIYYKYLLVSRLL